MHTFLPKSLAEESITPDWEVVSYRAKSSLARGGLLGGAREPTSTVADERLHVEESCKGSALGSGREECAHAWSDFTT